LSEKVKPKHEQLKQEIEQWIASGQYRPNDRLPTEHEMAQQSGVSRQTVRQAIGALVQEGRLFRKQGSGTYVAEIAARQESEWPAIGVMTTYISDYIFPEIVRGIESVLRSKGYPMILSSTDNDKSKERESLVAMMAGQARGLIIEPTRSAQGNANLDRYLALSQMKIPYVMINERYPELDCPCVKMDDEQGGFLAAKHLIALGHRRIAGFFKTDDLQGVQRLRGFLRAHQALKVPLLPEAVVQYATEEKREHTFQRALAYLQLPAEVRPTAFVGYNDELAVWLLEAVRQAGLRVPDDLSLVGFDDSFLATATEIKLTSVAHRKHELGAQAAELLIAMLEGRSGVKDIVYPPELIVRESTRTV